MGYLNIQVYEVDDDGDNAIGTRAFYLAYLALLSLGAKHKEIDAINAIVVSTIDELVDTFISLLFSVGLCVS